MAKPMTWTERELCEHSTWMRRLARRLTEDMHQAEDLVQDAWVAALEEPSDLARPRGWLGAVLRHRSASASRLRGRRAERERRAAREGEIPGPDELAAQIELQVALARAVLALDEPQRQAIALRFFHGWPPRRIATELGIDVRAVESRLRRGLAELRKKLDADHDGRREAWLPGLVALGAPAAKPLALATGAIGLSAGLAAVAWLAWPSAESPSAATAPVGVAAVVAPAPADEAASSTPAPAAPVQSGRSAPPPPSTALLTFVRADDGEPLEGIEVHGARETTWRTDEAGKLAIAWPEDGSSMALEVPATSSTREEAFFLDRPGEHVLAVARRGGTLRGLVVDLDGRPVPHAEVRLFDYYELGYTLDWAEPARIVHADAVGAFQVEDLADERGRFRHYSLLASAPNAFSVSALEGTVAADEERFALLVTEPARAVRGRVTAWDRPRVPGAPIFAYARNDESVERAGALLAEQGAGGRRLWGLLSPRSSVYLSSDERGEFALFLTEAPWHLQVDHAEYPGFTTWLEGEDFIEVHLGHGLDLEGRVLDAAGAAVGDAEVSLHAHEQREPVRTLADGSFRFESLTPLEGAIVAVSARGHACAVVPVDLAVQRTALEVHLGREHVVRGRLVAPDGEPVVCAKLEIRGDRLVGSPWIPRSRGFTWESLVSPVAWCASTDGEGRFEFRGLYPGTFRVRAAPTDGALASAWALATSSPASLDAPQLELRVGDLSGSASVRGTLRLADGSVPEPVDVVFTRWVDGEDEPTTERAGGTFSGGVFELAGLDPGRWQLTARALGGSGAYSGPVQELGPDVHVFEVLLEAAP